MKKILSTTLALAMASALCVPAMAASEPTPEVVETSAVTTSVTPRINWTGTAKLNTSDYANITSSNNVFPDSPLVTSNGNNTGAVYIRVLDEDGAIVGGIKKVYPGRSVRLDQIPALSGTYTIQGKAVSTPGTYTFNID